MFIYWFSSVFEICMCENDSSMFVAIIDDVTGPELGWFNYVSSLVSSNCIMITI